MIRRSDEKETKVEAAKRQSRHLRGTIRETLDDADAESFGEDDKQVLKFHGIYQQDDRDSRIARRHEGIGKAYSFMVRIAVPGGVLTADQYLAIDSMASEFGNDSFRLTTRQSVQLHGVIRSELEGTIRRINETLLSTFSACGDVPRNVMATPAPFADEPHRQVAGLTRELARVLAPATGAYHEIWLDGERLPATAAEEPLYGDGYLPRKFKIGITIDGDNSVDLYSYDAGLVAIVADGRVIGYDLLLGGGLGMTHNRPETIARLATPIAFVPSSRVIDVMREVIALFRDFGSRTDRRQARLKYLLESWGVERFRAELERRLGSALDDPLPMRTPRQHDFIGRHDQGDGRQFYGVFVQNGRVVDRRATLVRTALRTIITRYRPGIRLTPMQSVLLTDLRPEQVDRIIDELRGFGVRTDDELSNARRYSMACPALPTCGLALAEAERLLPEVIDRIEETLDELGLADVPLAIRMTGCPNGCARPYNADIGLVGRRPGVYHLYIGGGLAGDRIADLFAADVPVGELIPVLRPLLGRFARERDADESLGDFYQRLRGHERPRTVITGRETPSAALVQLEVRR